MSYATELLRAQSVAELRELLDLAVQDVALLHELARAPAELGELRAAHAGVLGDAAARHVLAGLAARLALVEWREGRRVARPEVVRELELTWRGAHELVAHFMSGAAGKVAN